MTIAGPPDTLLLVLVASILAIVVVPIGLLVVSGLLSLLRRVGIDLGAAPGVLLLLALPGGLFALSLALDDSGQAQVAQVIDKREMVRVNADGGWNDDLTLTVRFANDGAPLPPVRSTGAALGEVTVAGGTMSTAAMRVDSHHFDRVGIGDPFDLKVLPLRNAFSVVRPADVSTRSLVPPGMLELGIAGAALLFLGIRLRRRRIGIAILLCLVLAVFSYPLVRGDQLSRASEDFSGATQRSTAAVVDVSHITEIDSMLLGGSRYSSTSRHTVPQPYDVVQLEFPAAGYPGQVTAIDAIDTTSSGLTPGQQVTVLYAPDDPHGARIEGQTRTHYWRTPLSEYTDLAWYAAAVIVFTLGLAFFVRKYRARRAVAQPQ